MSSDHMSSHDSNLQPRHAIVQVFISFENFFAPF